MDVTTGRSGRLVGGLPTSYWRLWSASAASNLADGVFWIAFPLLAVTLTDSPAAIAGVAIAGRSPWLVFVLFAGALADRLDRRRTMIAVTLLRTVVALLLGVGAATGSLTMPVLYVAAFVLGVGETLFDTAAQSVMPAIVDRDKLSVANGRLYAVEVIANQFVGPPLGGILAAVSVALAFAGSSVAFLFAALALFLLRGSFRPVPAALPPGVTRRPGMLREIREGLRYLLRHRLLRTLALMVGVMNLASSAAFAVFVLYAVAPGPMGLDGVGFGVLMTALAIGSLAGSVMVGRVEARLGRERLLLFAVVLSGVTMLVPGLTANAWLVGASFALAGLGIVLWNVVTVSLRQRIVPDHLLGRVNASYRLLAWGSQPIGALLGGLIGEWLGLQAVFLLAGVTTLVLVGARRIVTDEAIVAAEAEGEREAAAAAEVAARTDG